MSDMSNKQNVLEQYADDENLSTRIKLHNKYSTNKYEFKNWVYDQYHIFEGARILELGCGTAEIWYDKIKSFPNNTLIVLSDLSENMVNTVWMKMLNYTNVSVKIIDIQNISFPKDTFNVVIANHVLHHVPDMERALSEVYRVLQPSGRFYATAVGAEGMNKYLCDVFNTIDPGLNVFNSDEFNFTLQNGQKLLKRYFSQVKELEYSDELRITNTDELMDWIRSTMFYKRLSEQVMEKAYNYFEKIRKDVGYVSIPKQVGMFICQK